MPTLWIREYSRVGAAPSEQNSNAGNLPVADEPGTDQTPVEFSNSVQSAGFGMGTKFISMIASDAFHYVVGVDPEATIEALRIPRDTLLSIGVKPGDRIAVIAAVGG